MDGTRRPVRDGACASEVCFGYESTMSATGALGGGAKASRGSSLCVIHYAVAEASGETNFSCGRRRAVG